MDTGERISVFLEVDAQAPGEALARPVRPGDTLRSGEGLGLRVWVDAPAHVLVVWYGRAGYSAQLFPGSGDGRLGAGERVVVTAPGGGRLYLDDQAGPEELYVAAAARPLDEADPALRRRLRLPPVPAAQAVRGDDDDPPPPPPPDGVPPDQRGGERAAGRAVCVQTGEDGVALLRFSFDHRS